MKEIPKMYKIFQFTDGKWGMITQLYPTVIVSPTPNQVMGFYFDNTIEEPLEFDRNAFPEIDHVFEIESELSQYKKPL